MKYTPRQYALSLFGALEESRPEESKLIYQNFIKLLVKNNDLGLAEKIYEELTECIRQKQNILLVEVVTATPLDTELRKKLKYSLEEQRQKEIELKEIISPEILGGAILKIKDLLIDGSLKKRLDSLKKILAS